MQLKKQKFNNNQMSIKIEPDKKGNRIYLKNIKTNFIQDLYISITPFSGKRATLQETTEYLNKAKQREVTDYTFFIYCAEMKRSNIYNHLCFGFDTHPQPLPKGEKGGEEKKEQLCLKIGRKDCEGKEVTALSKELLTRDILDNVLSELIANEEEIKKTYLFLHKQKVLSFIEKETDLKLTQGTELGKTEEEKDIEVAFDDLVIQNKFAVQKVEIKNKLNSYLFLDKTSLKVVLVENLIEVKQIVKEAEREKQPITSEILPDNVFNGYQKKIKEKDPLAKIFTKRESPLITARFLADKIVAVNDRYVLSEEKNLDNKPIYALFDCFSKHYFYTQELDQAEFLFNLE